jgi:hypothetical protein
VVKVVGEARGKADIATTNPDQKLETLLTNIAIFDETWKSRC